MILDPKKGHMAPGAHELGHMRSCSIQLGAEVLELLQRLHHVLLDHPMAQCPAFPKDLLEAFPSNRLHLRKTICVSSSLDLAQTLLTAWYAV